MSVMTGYSEGVGDLFPRLYDDLGLIPGPPGTDMGPIAALSLFSELVSALSLVPIPGTFTPWATRQGDMDWEEIKNPDTVVKCWKLNDAQVAAVPEVTFGTPLPFVVVVTRQAMSTEQVRQMWLGTAYQPYETQAMYMQEDAQALPTPYFFHWGERIDESKLPSQTIALEPRAKSVQGDLVFAAQIPAQGAVTRVPPDLSFQQALQTSMLPPSPAPAPVPPSPAPIVLRQTEEPMHLGVPIAVGLGAAALGYFLWTKRKR